MDFLFFSLGASRVGVIRVEVLRLVGIEVKVYQQFHFLQQSALISWW
jgi:hypothetical protein